jgi:hypothetical protein
VQLLTDPPKFPAEFDSIKTAFNQLRQAANALPNKEAVLKKLRADGVAELTAAMAAKAGE